MALESSRLEHLLFKTVRLDLGTVKEGQQLIMAHNYPGTFSMRLDRHASGRWFAVVIAIAAISFLMLPSVSMAQSTGIQVFDVDSYQKSISAGDTATFRWSVFNGGNSSLLIDTYAGAPDGYLTVTTDPNFLVVRPGQNAQVFLNVTASRSAPMADHSFTVSLNITRMDDPASETIVVKGASLHVSSYYGDESKFNKILGEFDNPLPAPFNDNRVTFLISALIWAGIAGALILVLFPAVKFLTRKTETQLDDKLLAVSKWPIFLVVLGYGTKTSLEILSLPREWIPGIEDGYFILMVLVGTWWAYGIFDSIVLEYGRSATARTDTEYDDVVINVSEKLGAIIIPLIGLTIVLARLGYNVTALLATLGFMGMVIGLAAKPTLSNFFGGLEIMMDHPYRPGDLVKMDGGKVFQVLKVGMRSTRLYDNDNASVQIIPNNIMAKKRITNVIRPDRKMRLRADLHIPYEADMDRVKELVLEAAVEFPDASRTPGFVPMVIITNFNDSWVDLICYIWVDDANIRKRALSDFREKAFAKLRKAGIEVPYPRTDAELHKSST
jgi:MscS family membrane protein